jgi:hypothetical protein
LAAVVSAKARMVNKPMASDMLRLVASDAGRRRESRIPHPAGRLAAEAATPGSEISRWRRPSAVENAVFLPMTSLISGVRLHGLWVERSGWLTPFCGNCATNLKIISKVRGLSLR